MYRAIPKTKTEQNHLRSLSLSTEAYDFWSLPKKLGANTDVLVAPEFQANFEQFLQRFDINYTIAAENIAAMVQRERFLQGVSRAFSQSIKFNRYYRFNEINDYLDELATNYPNLVTVKTIGKSYENRDLKTITISDDQSNEPKKTILVDAGIHSREWIAPSTALYIVNQLVEHYSENKNLLKNLNWVVLPVVNPDGYEFTHTGVRCMHFNIFDCFFNFSTFFNEIEGTLLAKDKKAR